MPAVQYWGLRSYQADGETLAGQWGSEPTMQEYIDHLVALFHELWTQVYRLCRATRRPALTSTEETAVD